MTQENLENLGNGWKYYFYHQAGRHGDIVWYIHYVREHNWERDINNFATTTQVQVAVDTTYLICCSKTILKIQATIHPTKINFLEIFS